MNRVVRCGLAGLALAAVDFASATAADEKELLKNATREASFRFLERQATNELGISALGSVLPRLFGFPTDVRANSVFGIDISHHNCTCDLDWNLIQSQKVSFVYLKSTEGATVQDERFSGHWSRLAQIPMHRGAYHFLSPYSAPEDQAQNFLKMIGTMKPTDLPPALDMESTDGDNPANDGWNKFSSDKIIAVALKWLNLVEKSTGRTPVIYTNYYWWKDHIGDDKMSRFARYKIWIADYSKDGLGQEKPNVPSKRDWAFWQFTDKAKISGIPTGVDASIFPGSLADFQKTLKLQVLTAQAPARGAQGDQFANNAPPNQSTDSNPFMNPGDQSVNPNTFLQPKNEKSGGQAANPTPDPPSAGNQGNQGDQATNPPAAPPATSAPSDQASAPPATPPASAPPSDQASAPPPTPPVSAPPSDQASAPPPTPPASTPPSDQASTPPAAPPASTPPSDQASAPPATPPVSAPPSDQASAPPTAPPASTPPNNQASASPTAPSTSATPTASKPDAGSGVADASPPRKTGERMAEIVFKNGRVLRVNPNISPALLERLIAIVEAP